MSLTSIPTKIKVVNEGISKVLVVHLAVSAFIYVPTKEKNPHIIRTLVCNTWNLIIFFTPCCDTEGRMLVLKISCAYLFIFFTLNCRYLENVSRGKILLKIFS